MDQTLKLRQTAELIYPARNDFASRKLRIVMRVLGCAALLWYTAPLCLFLGANRTTAAMVLLLEVLAVATLGDALLAFLSSTAASLAFSFYFIEPLGSMRLTTVRSAVTFAAMALTAVTASQLSSRAQRRMRDAIDRREEMDRLNQLGRVLIAANTLAEGADNAVHKVVDLFGLDGASLRIGGISRVFQCGNMTGQRVSTLPLSSESGAGILELHGAALSEEVASAIASMIRLVLERARSSEERAGIEAARRGEELRSTVLNALAHSFKTPLTSIKAAASTLRGAGDMSLPDKRELIAVIDEEADRLNLLICESLELAKLEGRRVNPWTEGCRISGVVERVVSRMKRSLGARDLTIEMPDDLPLVTGDSFLLEQMVLQVVDNAWKYSRPGTPIRITAATSKRNVILTVHNEGAAIPERERERIFEKFYRGAKDRSAVEGTGLGLVIAKTIAESHGGRLWLDIQPDGPAFHFALPIEAAGEDT